MAIGEAPVNDHLRWGHTGMMIDRDFLDSGHPGLPPIVAISFIDLLFLL